MDKTKRFDTLEGLRGVAALMVMFFHAGSLAPVRMPGGYLAVDVFFVLSGFVVAMVYEKRLRDGLTLAQFTRWRLVRVYPMYLAGAVLGSLIYGWRPGVLLMLPDFTSTHALFPTNAPMWSLFLELVINIAFAACALRLGWISLLVILAASGAIFANGIVSHGSADLGAFWKHAELGLARTLFAFALGVAFYRLRERQGLEQRKTWLAWLLLPALVACLAVPLPYRAWWDMACVFAILPLLVWLGTFWEVPHARAVQRLGEISYPLYCIHAPIIWTLDGSRQQMLGAMAIAIAAAWSLERYMDQPLRKRLNALLRPRGEKAAVA